MFHTLSNDTSVPASVVVDIEDAVRASSKASLHDSVVLLEEGRIESAAEGVGDKLIRK